MSKELSPKAYENFGRIVLTLASDSNTFVRAGVQSNVFGGAMPMLKVSYKTRNGVIDLVQVFVAEELERIVDPMIVVDVIRDKLKLGVQKR